MASFASKRKGLIRIQGLREWENYGGQAGELPYIRRYSTVEILGDSLPGWYA
jgi:hypothetical protein